MLDISGYIWERVKQQLKWMQWRSRSWSRRYQWQRSWNITELIRSVHRVVVIGGVGHDHFLVSVIPINIFWSAQ